MSLRPGVVLADLTQLSKSLEHPKNLHGKNRLWTWGKHPANMPNLKMTNLFCIALEFNSPSWRPVLIATNLVRKSLIISRDYCSAGVFRLIGQMTSCARLFFVNLLSSLFELYMAKLRINWACKPIKTAGWWLLTVDQHSSFLSQPEFASSTFRSELKPQHQTSYLFRWSAHLTK